MKKILIATDSFLPRADGIAIFLKEIIPKLKEKYEIKIAAPDFGKPGKWMDPFYGVELYRFEPSKWKIGDYNVTFPKKSIMKKLVAEADIIFTQTLGPIGITAMKLAKR